MVTKSLETTDLECVVMVFGQTLFCEEHVKSGIIGGVCT